MVNALLVHEDGKIEKVSYNDYKDLQNFVGGYIEGLHLINGFAYIDEEGKLKHKDVNPLATKLWFELAGLKNHNDFIVGKMIITGVADDEGNDTDIKQEVIEKVMKIAG